MKYCDVERNVGGLKMDKKRIYVFGCGRYFQNKQSSIIENYDIEAVLDNHKEGEINFISLIKIKQSFDFY